MGLLLVGAIFIFSNLPTTMMEKLRGRIMGRISVHRHQARVPVEYRAKQMRIPETGENLKEGELLYQTYCVACL